MQLNAGADKQVKALLRTDINWEYLIKIASMHGLIPLVYKSLKVTQSNDIPEWILEKLHKYFLANATHNIILTEELLKILRLFKDNGISAIPYKGPTLAILAYGDIASRQFTDLDILIHENDTLKAKKLLISKGYRTEIELTETQEKIFLKSQRDLKFFRDNGVLSVELQWDITPTSFPFSLDLDSLRQRLEPISLGDIEVKTFSPEDLILILCIHGLYHCWKQLEWICDLARLILCYKDIRWRYVLQNARGLGAERLVLFGLLLADNLFHVGLSEEILKRIENDQALKSLVNQRIEKIFGKEVNSRKVLDYSMFHLNMWKGIKEKVRHCFKLAFTPNVKDAMFLPLPAFLFSFYSLIRPIRLTVEYGVGILHSMNHKDT